MGEPRPTDDPLAGLAAPDGDLLLELIGDIVGMLDIDELRLGLIASLHRVIPSDYISLNDVHPDPERVVAIVRPEADAELLDRWREHAQENPLLRYTVATGDGRAKRFSDVISREDFHALALYRNVYLPMGVEHQMAFTLPGSRGRVLAVALSRCKRDFTDSERALADRARPFLIQAYLNAIAYERVRAGHDPGERPAPERLTELGLTPREADVMCLLAVGRSNRDIALELGISPRTVGKHLEHGFRKLGVGDRSSAAARVWELGTGAPVSAGGRGF